MTTTAGAAVEAAAGPGRPRDLNLHTDGQLTVGAEYPVKRFVEAGRAAISRRRCRRARAGVPGPRAGSPKKSMHRSGLAIGEPPAAGHNCLCNYFS
jgi:hypothetical protein